jgi:hypothetical protein
VGNPWIITREAADWMRLGKREEEEVMRREQGQAVAAARDATDSAMSSC